MLIMSQSWKQEARSSKSLCKRTAKGINSQQWAKYILQKKVIHSKMATLSKNDYAEKEPDKINKIQTISAIFKLRFHGKSKSVSDKILIFNRYNQHIIFLTEWRMIYKILI